MFEIFQMISLEPILKVFDFIFDNFILYFLLILLRDYEDFILLLMREIWGAILDLLLLGLWFRALQISVGVIIYCLNWHISLFLC